MSIDNLHSFLTKSQGQVAATREDSRIRHISVGVISKNDDTDVFHGRYVVNFSLKLCLFHGNNFQIMVFAFFEIW